VKKLWVGIGTALVLVAIMLGLLLAPVTPKSDEVLMPRNRASRQPALQGGLQISEARQIF
jgi:hypothetical protein